jgi:hypothetical protein
MKSNFNRARMSQDKLSKEQLSRMSISNSSTRFTQPPGGSIKTKESSLLSIQGLIKRLAVENLQSEISEQSEKLTKPRPTRESTPELDLNETL